jgi:hypothetical protein
VLLEHFEPNLGNTTGGEAQDIGGSMGQVDDPIAMEGASIVDPNNS